MATFLKYLAIASCVLILGACSAPWSSHSAPATATTGTVSSVEPTATATPLPMVTSEPSAPAVAVPTVTPTPTPAPTVVPTPTPSVIQAPVAGCCGVFEWAAPNQLLVYDEPKGGKSGSYLVNVQAGNRTLLSSEFGIPSQSGLIAFPNRTGGTTQIRELDGSVVSTVHNGGRVTWISPNGKRIAWLVDQGIPNTSSEVMRVVRLMSANVDGSNQKSLVELEASSIQWLPDNVHVMAIARAQNGTHSGIWTIDTNTGTNAVVIQATYVFALALSPDGTKMAYLVTFSGDPAKDGVWVANVDGSHQIHLSQVGAFRWASNSSSLWFLQLASPGGGQDHVEKVNIATDSVTETVPLGGRVLGGEWAVNPTGEVVAYWNEADQSVYVKALTP